MAAKKAPGVKKARKTPDQKADAKIAALTKKLLAAKARRDKAVDAANHAIFLAETTYHAASETYRRAMYAIEGRMADRTAAKTARKKTSRKTSER